MSAGSSLRCVRVCSSSKKYPARTVHRLLRSGIWAAGRLEGLLIDMAEWWQVGRPHGRHGCEARRALPGGLSLGRLFAQRQVGALLCLHQGQHFSRGLLFFTKQFFGSICAKVLHAQFVQAFQLLKYLVDRIDLDPRGEAPGHGL